MYQKVYYLPDSANWKRARHDPVLLVLVAYLIINEFDCPFITDGVSYKVSIENNNFRYISSFIFNDEDFQVKNVIGSKEFKNIPIKLKSNSIKISCKWGELCLLKCKN